MSDNRVIRLFPGSDARDPAAVAEQMRMVEAILFASTEPVSEDELRKRLPDGADCAALLDRLVDAYAGHGVNLVRVAGKWAFRSAPDLAYLMTRERVESRKLSRAAMETLAIIAYHQPVTRAEIEEIRGVSISAGTLDMLLEAGWVRLRGRRRVPGRPVTFGTTDGFLEHFGLEAITDLPGLGELSAAGLLAPTPLSAAAGEDEGVDQAAEEPEDEEALDFALLHAELPPDDEDETG